MSVMGAKSLVKSKDRLDDSVALMVLAEVPRNRV